MEGSQELEERKKKDEGAKVSRLFERMRQSGRKQRILVEIRKKAGRDIEDEIRTWDVNRLEAFLKHLRADRRRRERWSIFGLGVLTTVVGVLAVIVWWIRVWPDDSTLFSGVALTGLGISVMFSSIVGLGPFAIVEYSYGKILEDFSKRAEESQLDKKAYIRQLSEATGDQVFKYLLLINVSTLEEYVAQTRIQASQSFRLSQVVAVVGFVLLAIGILLGVFTQLFTEISLDAAYLAALAGILTEFISGTFFYIYNKTLQQINRFHDKLVSSQRDAIGLLAASTIEGDDPAMKNQAKIDLSKLLVSANVVHDAD